MAKYSFQCECGKSKSLYTSFDAVVKCECGRDIKASLPTITAATVKETVDKLSGTKQLKDQKEVLIERSEDFFWSVEVPRMVESGIYSMETMLERQWVYYDEQGNLRTRTKPPHKSK